MAPLPLICTSQPRRRIPRGTFQNEAIRLLPSRQAMVPPRWSHLPFQFLYSRTQRTRSCTYFPYYLPCITSVRLTTLKAEQFHHWTRLSQGARVFRSGTIIPSLLMSWPKLASTQSLAPSSTCSQDRPKIEDIVARTNNALGPVLYTYSLDSSEHSWVERVEYRGRSLLHKKTDEIFREVNL